MIGGQLKLADAYLISEADFEEIQKRSRVHRWDVLISMIGTVGEVFLVKDEPDFAIKNIGLFKSKDEARGRWLYYFLKTPTAQQDIIGKSRGTTQSYIPLGELRRLPIAAPESAEAMTGITDVLRVLDDKIELNRRMSGTLEEMARALYRSWFVDFDPVHARALGQSPAHMDATTAALFPDSFGPDGLPKGWEMGTISDLGRVVTGKTPSTKQPENYGDFCPFVKIPDMHGKMFVLSSSSWLSESGVQRQRNQLLAPGSVSVSCIATPGLVAINPSSAMTNQQINSVEPVQGFSTEFVYWTCVQAANDVLLGGSGGSVFHNTNKSTFSAIPIVLGPQKIRDAFTEIVAPWHSKILHLEKESQTLAALRDTLLPRLMSGELRIREAEKQVEEVTA
ncbi:hypothetical protein AVJ23_19800 [Pseudoponticoccus marisrubri]|uniref:Type I restriction modification DNA specificity domain-containing protein n=2 Tax=Pseudoponticoccus marisrubri TaxID=1685382 RepID=A0A0W7WEI6_9RHOB|nr:hypothetical protein AVJ23_19800 [Pseudoponticoccus marisrubri]